MLAATVLGTWIMPDVGITCHSSSFLASMEEYR